MKKLVAIVVVALAALLCQNVSLQTLANGISVPMPAVDHAVGKLWKTEVNDPNPMSDGTWRIMFYPESPVASGTEVTVYALYTASDNTPGGLLDVHVSNASSPCLYGSAPNPITGILPANPTLGVPYAIGTFQALNFCKANKVLAVTFGQATVGGASIVWAQGGNYVVIPEPVDP